MSKLDELIAELCPNGVEYKRVKDIAIVSIGEFVHKNLQNPNSLYPVYNGGTSNTGFYDKYNRTANKIIISARGANAGFVNRVFTNYWSGNSCYTIDVENDNMNWNFTYYWLKSKERNLLDGQQKAGIPAVSKRQVEDFFIPVPPLPVQGEIVRILDNFTELTAELTAELIARKKQYEYYRDSLLTFGDNVEWKTLGECILKADNMRWGENKEENFQYIDLSSVNRDDNKIYETQIIHSENAPSRAKQIVVKNDVIFGSTRPMLKRYCLVPEEYDNQICSTGFCVLRANLNLILPKWVFYNISTTAFYTYVEKNQKGASYPAISDKEVKAYKIPLPPIDEQQRIIDILDRFGTLCNEITTGLSVEIEARQKQYEYYRDKLLTFEEIS